MKTFNIRFTNGDKTLTVRAKNFQTIGEGRMILFYDDTSWNPALHESAVAIVSTVNMLDIEIRSEIK